MKPSQIAKENGHELGHLFASKCESKFIFCKKCNALLIYNQDNDVRGLYFTECK